MLHIQTFPWRARERSVGLFALLVISMALVIMAAGISQWFGEQLRSGGLSITSPSGAPGFATSSYPQIPMAMTIPCAIAQAQQDFATLRHNRKASSRGLHRHSEMATRNRTGLNGARGLIAGLAIARALGSAH